MNLGDKKGNNDSKYSYGFPQTGNMKSYMPGGLNHNQRIESLNHQTHPDALNHRQKNSFGK